MNLRNIAFGSLITIAAIMAVASVLEKAGGYSSVAIYTSWWMVTLWALMALIALAYILRRRVRPAVLALHVSLLVILAGAAVTWATGDSGTLSLSQGATATTYDREDGTKATLPFKVSLSRFDIVYYEGTSAPRDYVSQVVIDGKPMTISMNNIASHQGFRFYQSGYDSEGGTVLSVSHDPWGIAVTYTGYAMLLLSIIVFFLAPGSTFRALLKHPSLRGAAAIVAILLAANAQAQSESLPPTVSPQVAEQVGRLYVLHNDRVCPVQTLARDFTRKLTKKTSYRGLSAEQVLLGFYCYPQEWMGENLIDLNSMSPRELEKVEIANMLVEGKLLRMFPHRDRQSGTITWYAPADSLPAQASQAKRDFMRYALTYLNELAHKGDDRGMAEYLGRIALYQSKECAGTLPSPSRLKAELAYNSLSHTLPVAAAGIVVGLVAFIYMVMATARSRQPRRLWIVVLNVALALMWLYITAMIGLRWVVSGHVPMSNGYETMQLMAWLSLTFTAMVQRRWGMALPFGFLLAGLTMMVSMMGESNPQISHLVPVLHSPLLSIHVAVIMIAYSLLAFAMLNGITAIILCLSGVDTRSPQIERLAIITRIMLYPAVMLLAVGIFIGAVWANVSWGRYWGWDPKEVWALITLIIYSLALHTASIPRLARPMAVHFFSILAFLSVLITYFGVNYLLGGMHSYA